MKIASSKTCNEVKKAHVFRCFLALLSMNATFPRNLMLNAEKFQFSRDSHGTMGPKTLKSRINSFLRTKKIEKKKNQD